MIAITANKRPSGLIHLVDGDQSVVAKAPASPFLRPSSPSIAAAHDSARDAVDGSSTGT